MYIVIRLTDLISYVTYLYFLPNYLIFSVQIELKLLTKVQHGLQKMCQVSQDCLPS